jgi:hypothetical protein
MAMNLGMVAGNNRAAIEGDAVPVPGAPAEVLGRQIVGFQIRDVFDHLIRTDGEGLISFEPNTEFRIETVTSPEDVDKESILRSIEGLRDRRAAEGWELLCALPRTNRTELRLVFRRAGGRSISAN